MHRLAIAGTPQAMGHAHGEAFRTQIRELAAIRYDLIRRRMPRHSPAALHDLAMQQVDVLRLYRDGFAEFKALSEASGVDEAALMVLNNYTDMRDFHSPDEGCSLFALRQGGRHVCGQTWDMHASARPYVLHLTKSGGDTPAAEILTLTGCVGLAGVNASGLAVLINNLNCSETRINVMWPALVRGMLAQSSTAAALGYIDANLPCSGHNYLLCDGAGMVNVETTGQRYEKTFAAAEGVVFHTNHYVGALQAVEMKEKRSATTVPRYEAMARYFASRAAALPSLEEVGAELFSASHAGNVCVARTTDDASMTCGGILIDVPRRAGVIFAGSFDEGLHRPFQFS
jgi:isopenicillin-N N-acyltransferase-like protein